MQPKETPSNYWLLLSGFSSLCLLLSELSYKETTELSSELKSSIRCPVSLSSANNNELVYITGSLHTSEQIQIEDPLFRISVPGLRLSRTVEMLQYYKAPDESIKSAWFSEPIKSPSSEKANPKWKIHDLEATTKEKLMINEYEISSAVLKYIKTRRNVRGVYEKEGVAQDIKGEKVVLRAGQVEAVGDYRVKHDFIPDGLWVTVVGQQKEGKVIPGRVFKVEEGKVDLDLIIDPDCRNRYLRLWMNRTFCASGILLGIYKTYNL